jgi:hypothetical protein
VFGHLVADECGAMNHFLAAAPNAQVAHTARGCMVSIGRSRRPPPSTDRAQRQLGSVRELVARATVGMWS